MPAGLTEFFRMTREADRVSLDALEQLLGQDERLALDTRQMVEMNREISLTVLVHGQNMPTKSLAVPPQELHPAVT